MREISACRLATAPLGAQCDRKRIRPKSQSVTRSRPWQLVPIRGSTPDKSDYRTFEVALHFSGKRVNRDLAIKLRACVSGPPST
jgi:hypothetical protein